MKRYAKALADGASLEQSRSYAAAAEKYALAADALTPRVHSAALCSGMCRVQLRLRRAEEAMIWCERAAQKDVNDLEATFHLADAKVNVAAAVWPPPPCGHRRRVATAAVWRPPPCATAACVTGTGAWGRGARGAAFTGDRHACMHSQVLGGEEHAALQTLKTAQRRFPHHSQLAQKVHILERKIKQKSKVDYYKVLGVASSASAREIKKASAMQPPCNRHATAM